MSLAKLLGSSSSTLGETFAPLSAETIDYNGYMKYSSTAGLWASCSTDTGYVSISTNGVDWTPRFLPGSSALPVYPSALVWVGSRLILGTYRGHILISDDTFKWTLKRDGNSTVDGIYFTGMAYNGSSTVVAVGAGAIFYSSDSGNTWAKATDNYHGTSSSTEFLGVAWNGTVFSAWGRGTLATSSDGINWTFRNSSGPTYSITYSSSLGLFVKVGSIGYVGTSPDGTTWTARTKVSSNDMYRAYWGSAQGQFIATGRSGTIITSTNGTSWTSRTSGTTQDLWGAASNGSSGSPVYVVTGGNGVILSSTDLATWTSRTSNMGTSLITACVWSGSQFIAVGGSSTITKSSDGATWTAQTSALAAGTYYDIAHNGSMFVVVGSSGRIYTSTDGTTWTLRTSGVTATLRGVRWNGSSWIVCSQNAHILTSTDGVTWTSRTTNTGAILYAVSSSSSIVAAVGWGELLTSTDLTNWTGRGTSFCGEVYYDSTTGYFYVGDNVGTSYSTGAYAIMRSTDGIVWSRMGAITGTDNYDVMYRFTRAGSFLWGMGEAGGYLAKFDGSSWSGIYLNASRPVRSVVYTGGTYYVYNDSGVTATSTDGSTWTQYTQYSSGAFTKPYGYRAMAYSSQLRLFVASNSNSVYTSVDGKTWTYQTTVGSGTIGDIVWNGSTFVAVSSSGAFTSPNGSTWTQRYSATGLEYATWTGSRFIALRGIFSGAESYYSTDGTTWTAGGIVTGLTFPQALTWSKSAGKAVTGVFNGSSTSIYLSTDSTTWSSATVPSAAYHINGENTSITIAATTGGIYSSTDCVTWTQRSTTVVTRVFWTGKVFIGVNNTTLLYSKDGITWTTKTSNIFNLGQYARITTGPAPKQLIFTSDVLITSP